MFKDREPLNVEIDPRLNNPGLAYEVNVDTQRCLELFYNNGLSDGEIQKTKIRVRKNLSVASTLLMFRAQYVPFTRSISVYTDPTWQDHVRYMVTAERIVKGEMPPWRGLFAGVDNSKELVKVLSNEPPAQALDFAQSFLLSAANNDMNASLAHEMKHAVDLRTRRAWIERILSGVSGSLGGAALASVLGLPTEFFVAGGTYLFVNAFDPNEVRARRFEKTFKQSGNGNLITINPKSPNP